MANSRGKVLMVEDHPQTVYAVRPVFSHLQLQIDHVGSVQEAMHRMSTQHYDLVIVDRNLPDGDGLEVLEELQSSALPSRVLVLSQRSEMQEKMAGFEAGADDYLPKPFSAQELSARVRALLRRGQKIEEESLSFAQLTFYPAQALLEIGGETFHLSALPAKMLELLLRSQTKTVTREQLMNTLWPSEKYPQQASVDVLASRLRKTLKPFGVLIRSKPGIGYALAVARS